MDKTFFYFIRRCVLYKYKSFDTPYEGCVVSLNQKIYKINWCWKCWLTSLGIEAFCPFYYILNWNTFQQIVILSLRRYWTQFVFRSIIINSIIVVTIKINVVLCSTPPLMILERSPNWPKVYADNLSLMYPAKESPRWFFCWIHGKLDRQDRKGRHGGSLWQGR